MGILGDDLTYSTGLVTWENQKYALFGDLCNLDHTVKAISMTLIKCCGQGGWINNWRMGIYKLTDDVIANAILQATTPVAKDVGVEKITQCEEICSRTINFTAPFLLDAGKYALVVHNFGWNTTGRWLRSYAGTKVGMKIQKAVDDTFGDGLSDPFGEGGTLVDPNSTSLYLTYEEIGKRKWQLSGKKSCCMPFM